MYFDLSIPTKIKIGSLDELKAFLLKLKDRELLIVLSDRMEARFQLSDTIDILKKGNKVSRIDKVPANPTELDIHKALFNIEGGYDYVFALGGGSAIDLAKAVIALQYLGPIGCDGETIIHSVRTKEYSKYQEKLEFLAVPTTAGTGSEITSWATVWNSNGYEKLSIDAPWLAPDYAFIVPELTATLPLRLTLSTGLDALTHATESYWSRKSNPISRELSKTAIQLIVQGLDRVIVNPGDMEGRTWMCVGAVYAGMAFANTRTTACHSISYPITMRFGVEHGFAVALTLVGVMRYNRNSIIELRVLLQAFGAKDIGDIQRWLDHICYGIQPLRLQAFGIKQEDIQLIAEMSFTAGRMDNNPVDLDINAVKDILMDCV